MLALLVVASCSGDSEPTEAPTAAPPAATAAPTPEPTDAPAATATPGVSGEAAGNNGDEVTSEDVLATVFKDWGLDMPQ